MRILNLPILGLLVAAGCATGLGGGPALPTNSEVTNSLGDSVICATDLVPPHSERTVVSDFADGVSNDGRGPYIQGMDGVRTCIVLNFAALT